MIWSMLFAVAEFAQVGGCADDHIHPVHAGVHRHLDIFQRAAGVGQDLGAQPQPGNGPAVFLALRGGRRGGQFDVFHAKRIQQGGDADFLLGGEEGVDKLFAFSQG